LNVLCDVIIFLTRQRSANFDNYLVGPATVSCQVTAFEAPALTD